MPTDSIIDAHVHFWDPQRISYPWLNGVPSLNRPYLLEECRATADHLPVEAMIFVECDASPLDAEREVQWVSELAERDHRIQGIVAHASLEKGAAVRDELERLCRYPLVRGIRRIIQSEPDLEFCLRPDFIDGVRSLFDFDLSFDICIDHRHLRNILCLAEAVSNVPMILDHIGKPAIKDGKMWPWAAELRALARCPHVVCKISGVATEADHRSWTPEQLKPYIEKAIEAFGFDRILFGGDWPVSTQAIRYQQWVRLLDDTLTGVDALDLHKFWHDNAMRVYRLASPKNLCLTTAFA